MAAGEGFTPQDRETLIETKVRLQTLGETVGAVLKRVERLEETRITSQELNDLMSDTDSLRAEKKELEKRVMALENWRTQMLGMAAGAGAVVGALVTLLFKLFGK